MSTLLLLLQRNKIHPLSLSLSVCLCRSSRIVRQDRMLLQMYWLQQLLQHVLVVLRQAPSLVPGNLPLLMGLSKPPRILYRCPEYTNLFLYKICVRTRFGFVRDCTQQWKEKASSFLELLSKLLLDRDGRTEVRYRLGGKKYRIVLQPDEISKNLVQKSLLHSLDTVFRSTDTRGMVMLEKAVLHSPLWTRQSRGRGEDVTSRVLKYAGPQGDFYRPYGVSCRIADMFPKHPCPYYVTMTWRHRETGQVYERTHHMSDIPWQPGYLYPRVERYDPPPKQMRRGRVCRANKRIGRVLFFLKSSRRRLDQVC